MPRPRTPVGDRLGFDDPASPAAPSAAPWVPDRPTLAALAEAAAGCRGCHLHEHATQTVFGEGPAGAEVMLVGEQPGDREDVAGTPFVGPAGELLHRALGEAGIDPDAAYITNAVKHFKHRRQGARRIHDTPNEREIVACGPWLDAELEVVDPTLVVALGAIAAKRLLGRDFRVTRHRGELLEWDRRPLITATVHPSSILRSRERREKAYRAFVADLEAAADALAGARG